MGGRNVSPIEWKSMPDGTQTVATVATFESALDQLEKVVRELESGDLPLERSLDLFSRGVELSEACRKQLEDAETRVEALIRREGTYQAEPFRPEK